MKWFRRRRDNTRARKGGRERGVGESRLGGLNLTHATFLAMTRLAETPAALPHQPRSRDWDKGWSNEAVKGSGVGRGGV